MVGWTVVAVIASSLLLQAISSQALRYPLRCLPALSTYINTHFFEEESREGSEKEQKGVREKRERPQCLRLKLLSLELQCQFDLNHHLFVVTATCPSPRWGQNRAGLVKSLASDPTLLAFHRATPASLWGMKH